MVIFLVVVRNVVLVLVYFIGLMWWFYLIVFILKIGCFKVNVIGIDIYCFDLFLFSCFKKLREVFNESLLLVN